MASIPLSIKPYAPTHLQVDNLAVHVSSNTLNTLNFSATESLLVGESYIAQHPDPYYGLIVDEQGISVNTTRPQRSTTKNEYALYVDGNAYVTGTVYSSNVVHLLSGDGGGVINASSNFNYWRLPDGETQNIYYDGRITIGNENACKSNTYGINIVESADRSLDHAQFSIQNTQLSQLQVGILGTQQESPVIFHSKNAPIEFHVARNSNFFAGLYQETVIEEGDEVTNLLEVPNYSTTNKSDYLSNLKTTGASIEPSLTIDANGNVGIRTHQNLPITYEVRPKYFTTTTASSGELSTVFPRIREPMQLHVAGAMFASNILVYDYDSGKACNIDVLYARRSGVSVNAHNVYPGSFAKGYYQFQSNLAIGKGSAIETDYELSVNGSGHFTSNVKVDNILYVGDLRANQSTFYEDLIAKKDVIVRQSLRLRGGLMVESMEDGKLVWKHIQFTTFADRGLSNINYFGKGITTPGRFGCGIGNNQPVNNQMVSTCAASDIFELELRNTYSTMATRVAYIGHPMPASDMIRDCSLLIATPKDMNSNYNFTNGRVQQNIYLYPGTDVDPHPINDPIVRRNNPPVLGAFTSRRVGILTFDPQATLHVEGDLLVTSNMMTWDKERDQPVKLGKWLFRDYALPQTATETTGPYYSGIQYTDPAAPHVGIHTTPEPEYGLVVRHKIKSYDGFYTASNERILSWLDSATAANAVLPRRATKMYTHGKIGVGLSSIKECVEIKNAYDGDTRIKMYRGAQSPVAGLTFAGIQNQWNMDVDTVKHTMEIHNTSGTDSGISILYDTIRREHVVVIGSNEHVFDQPGVDRTAKMTVDGNLTVLGDVHITGNYYSSNILVTAGVAKSSNPSVSTDDVLIGGNFIHVVPAANMTVGYTQDLQTSEISQSLTAKFRVYQPDEYASTIARFTASGPNGLLEIANTQGDILKFGVYNQNKLAFLDGFNNPFFTFRGFHGNRYMGVNEMNPEAQLHITGMETGSNMFLMRRIVDVDEDEQSAEWLMQKQVQTAAAENALCTWKIKGPTKYADVNGIETTSTSNLQKLAFYYSDSSNVNDVDSFKELFTFTNTGMFGINNPTPEFALDVIGSGKTGSLRLYNPDNAPTPQLMFQSGPNRDFGADDWMDYRMFSCNNEFIFEQEMTCNLTRLLHFTSNAHVGIRTNADSRFALQLEGDINVTTGFYLDGMPLFTKNQQNDVAGFDIHAIDVFLRPEPTQGGGVVVNGMQGTSNLFHIFSGTDPNMMVYDSRFDTASVYYRVNGSTGKHIYRISMSNESYGIEYCPMSPDGDRLLDSDEGYVPATQWHPFENDLCYPGIIRFLMRHYGNMELMSEIPTLAFTNPNQPNNSVGFTRVGSNLHFFDDSLTGTFAFAQPYFYHDYLHQNPRVFIESGINQIACAIMQTDVLSTCNILNLIGRDWEPSNSVFVSHLGTIAIGSNAFIPNTKLNVKGTITVVDGTQEQPSLTFENSLGTGWYSPSNEQLAFVTAQRQAVLIKETGTVTVGAFINGTGTGEGQLTVNNSSNGLPCVILNQQSSNGHLLVARQHATSAAIIMTSNAWLGIGTETPLAPLHVHNGGAYLNGNVLPLGNANTHTHVLGNAANPWKSLTLREAISFTNPATSTGITMAAAYAADGTGRLQVARGTNVGGGWIPASIDAASLRIGQIGTGYDATFSVDTTNGLTKLTSYDAIQQTTQSFYLLQQNTATQQVGINTTNPSSTVHIIANSNIPALRVDQYGSGTLLQLSQSNVPVLQVAKNGSVYMSMGSNSNSSVYGWNSSAPSACFQIVNPSTTLESVVSLTQHAACNILECFGVNSETVVITSNGHVGIGTNMPHAGLHVNHTALFEEYTEYRSNVYYATDVEIQGNAVVHGDSTTDSDIRLKEDIERVQGALEKLTALTGYTYKKKAAPHRLHTGLVAQEVQNMIPEVVYEGADGFLSLAYGNLMGYVVEALKELREDVRSIKTRLDMS